MEPLKTPEIREVDFDDPEKIDLSKLKKAELKSVAEQYQKENEKLKERSNVLQSYGKVLASQGNSLLFKGASSLGAENGWEISEFEDIPSEEQNMLNEALVHVLEEYLPNIETSPLGVYAGTVALVLMKNSRRIEGNETENQHAMSGPGSTGNG